MFSYLKVLDICEQNITLTFHGKLNELNKFKKNIIKNFLDKATIIYKESNDQFFSDQLLSPEILKSLLHNKR